MLAPLQHAVVQLIFAQLPVDLRARCACVCRAWRAAVSARALWRRVDVSTTTSGVTARVTDALLRGAAARAGGELQALDVSGSRLVSPAALLAVAAANSRSLRELRVCNGVCNFDGNPMLLLRNAEALLRAAPQLRVLDADLECGSVAEGCRVLRAQEGFRTPLRVHGLRVRETDVLTLAPDVAAHAWLRELYVSGAQTPAALDAIVDAALARRLTAVQFVNCGLSGASAPALARLLSGSALVELLVWGSGDLMTLLHAPAAALLAGALRSNTTLTSLQLGAVQLWHNAAAAATLLDALTAHPSLRSLSLRANTVFLAWDQAHGAAAGAALGALLAANAPALTALDVSWCGLRDAGMASMCEALPGNAHLRSLNCESNHITAAFAHDVLLPAANANLHVLYEH